MLEGRYTIYRGAEGCGVARVTCCSRYTEIWSEARAPLNLSPPRYSATRRPFRADSPVYRARVHSAFFLPFFFFHRNRTTAPPPSSLFHGHPLPLSLPERTERKRGGTGHSRRRADPRRAEGHTAEARESCARPRARLTVRTTGARDTMGGRNRRRRPSTTDVSSVSLDGIL